MVGRMITNPAAPVSLRAVLVAEMFVEFAGKRHLVSLFGERSAHPGWTEAWA